MVSTREQEIYDARDTMNAVSRGDSTAAAVAAAAASPEEGGLVDRVAHDTVPGDRIYALEQSFEHCVMESRS